MGMEDTSEKVPDARDSQLSVNIKTEVRNNVNVNDNKTEVCNNENVSDNETNDYQIQIGRNKGCFGDLHFGVVLLAISFGIGAWVSINGLWTELPLLIDLPEGWTISSYLVVIIQIANLGPLLYTLLRLKFSDATVQIPSIYLILTIGCVASFLLAFLWDKTTTIAGVEHSVPLIVLVFFLATVDCTSSVLFIPYMGLWGSQYLPYYFFGESLSGLIPSIVVLIQGTDSHSGNNNGTNYTAENIGSSHAVTGKNFSVETFFFFLFAMILVSLISFFFLNNLKAIQKERAPTQQLSGHVNDISNYALPSNSRNLDIHDDHYQSTSLENARTSTTSQNNLVENETCVFHWSTNSVLFIFFCQFSRGFLTNGFLPGISTYTLQPYGTYTFHLVSSINMFSSPLAALCTIWGRRASPPLMAAILAAGASMCVFFVVAAVMSPRPPMLGTAAATPVIVLLSVLSSFLMSYVHVETNNMLRMDETSRGTKSLFYSGVSAQTGSFTGAIISFCLVNYTHIFHSK